MTALLSRWYFLRMRGLKNIQWIVCKTEPSRNTLLFHLITQEHSRSAGNISTRVITTGSLLTADPEIDSRLFYIVQTNATATLTMKVCENTIAISHWSLNISHAAWDAINYSYISCCIFIKQKRELISTLSPDITQTTKARAKGKNAFIFPKENEVKFPNWMACNVIPPHENSLCKQSWVCLPQIAVLYSGGLVSLMTVVDKIK